MLSANDDSSGDDFYTLLCVRADGVAPVVDLFASSDIPEVRLRAEALLREHASCETVEVWRGGALVEQFARA